jgi:hypothetical protein
MLSRLKGLLGLGDGFTNPLIDDFTYFDRGPTVPADGVAGFGVGCLFAHTDGGDGTALYVNEGTTASCDFNAVTVAA